MQSALRWRYLLGEVMRGHKNTTSDQTQGPEVNLQESLLEKAATGSSDLAKTIIKKNTPLELPTFMMVPLSIGHRLPFMLGVELLNAPPHQVLPAWFHGCPHGACVQRCNLACEIAAGIIPTYRSIIYGNNSMLKM